MTVTGAVIPSEADGSRGNAVSLNVHLVNYHPEFILASKPKFHRLINVILRSEATKDLVLVVKDREG